MVVYRVILTKIINLIVSSGANFPQMLKVKNSWSGFPGAAGKVFWPLSAILVLLLNNWLDKVPTEVELVYSRQIFPLLRRLFDFTLGWLPFPAIYVWMLLLLGWCIYLIRLWPGFPLREKKGLWINFLLRIISFFSILVVLFYLLWGFNYRRQSLEGLLGIKPEPLNPDELCEALERETTMVAKLRSSIDTLVVPPGMEDSLRNLLYDWSERYRLPVWGKVRAYRIYPRGIFLRFSSSGLYFPFSGQGQVDAGLHPLDLPYVMTHEMAHGLGYGDEGTCNFLAYAATTSSNNPFIKYAGHLSYWRTLASNYNRYRPDDFRRIREQIPAAILEDIKEIYATLDQYPDIMPRLRNRLYNSYLQIQGISEGIKNYNRVIMLVNAWEKQSDSE